MFRELSFKYFQVFSEKNISTLSTMLAPSVSLRDWDISAEGFDAVVAANLNIFNAVKTIKVNPINVFQDGSTVIAELIIEIDGITQLKVVDVLTFDDAGKISAIRAYKG